MVEVAGTAETDITVVLGGDVNVAREAPTEAFRGIEPVLVGSGLSAVESRVVVAGIR